MFRSFHDHFDVSIDPQSTYKRALLRKPNKAFLVSLGDFEQGVEDKYRLIKGKEFVIFYFAMLVFMSAFSYPFAKNKVCANLCLCIVRTFIKNHKKICRDISIRVINPPLCILAMCQIHRL